MDFTATAAISPQPHVDLALEADPGSIFTNVTIRRDGRPLRNRVVAGGDEATVTDFEPPLGRLMNYRADVEVVDGWESVFSEGWLGLDMGEWLTVSGNPSSGTGVLVSSDGEESVVGNLTAPQPTLGRLVIDGYVGNPNGTAFLVGPVWVSLGPASVTVRHLLSSPVSVPYVGGDIEVTWSLTSARLTTSVGSVTVERGLSEWSLAVGVILRAGGFAPAFEIFESDPDSVATHTLYASTHVPESRVWLIHPTLPSLSLPIDGGDGDLFIERDTRRNVTHVARFARFDPHGRNAAVVYPLGGRAKPEWDLSVFCRDLAARDAVLNLLRDSQPVLLRVPSGYGSGRFDVPDGWHQVEDVSEVVVGARGRHGYRLMKLAMTPVSEPPVSISTITVWGGLVADNLTWGDLIGHDWHEVMAGMGEV